MKMGTIASPWHYDVGAYITMQPLKMRRAFFQWYHQTRRSRRSNI
jgi:hypothetical protein